MMPSADLPVEAIRRAAGNPEFRAALSAFYARLDQRVAAPWQKEIQLHVGPTFQSVMLRTPPRIDRLESRSHRLSPHCMTERPSRLSRSHNR
jgi:hypothetical protein